MRAVIVASPISRPDHSIRQSLDDQIKQRAGGVGHVAVQIARWWSIFPASNTKGNLPSKQAQPTPECHIPVT
jgi:hypothetical protein